MSTYSPGTLVTLSALFEAVISGSPIEPTTVTCVVTDPLANVTTYSGTSGISNPSTGSFSLNITPVTAGTWTYVWTSTGTVAATATGSFLVLGGVSTVPTMAAQPTSGTYGFDPGLSDLVVEAYSRCGVRPGAFTADHMFQARMSAQLMLSTWSVRVPNLWLVTQGSIPLTQGVSTYSMPSNTVTILDAFVRLYQVGNPVNETVAFSTVSGSTTVTITWAGSGLSPGQWMSVYTPVSVGGIVLQGFYQVAATLTLNTFTIVAGTAATSTVTTGGVVPVFTTAQGSTSVLVTFPNHGLLVGNTFIVQVATVVGGMTLTGSYTVAATPTTGTFTITATMPAAATATVAENGGLVQFQSQLPNVDPTDRVVTPISRTDWSAQPDKFAQGYPSVYWFNRQINPTITMWNVPDQNGPYVYYYYSVTQAQDAVLEGGVTLDIPYRFLEAFAAGLARRLARKFAPSLVQELIQEENMAWGEAATEDVEDVPMMITPACGSYYR